MVFLSSSSKNIYGRVHYLKGFRDPLSKTKNKCVIVVVQLNEGRLEIFNIVVDGKKGNDKHKIDDRRTGYLVPEINFKM